MSTLSERNKRAVLVLGPPNSGKSVFSYLLFRALRYLENDPALFDCDVKAPTFRRFDLASTEEAKHIYSTPNAQKADISIPLEIYKSYIELNFLLVREKGLIVMDGMGRHDEMTENLIQRTGTILVVCRDSIKEQEQRECKYLKDDRPQHPFQFYSSFGKQLVKVTTFENAGGADFDPQSLSATLCGLKRDGIKKGEIVGIPQNTLDSIIELSRFLLSK